MYCTIDVNKFPSRFASLILTQFPRISSVLLSFCLLFFFPLSLSLVVTSLSQCFKLTTSNVSFPKNVSAFVQTWAVLRNYRTYRSGGVISRHSWLVFKPNTILVNSINYCKCKYTVHVKTCSKKNVGCVCVCVIPEHNTKEFLTFILLML